MNLALTTHSVGFAIDLLLDEGAAKLYDKYIQQKLPPHAYTQHNATLYNNLGLNEIAEPKKDTINSVAVKPIVPIPIDSFAPKRLTVNKECEGFSTVSPKNANFGKSTKYQTISLSQRSSVIKPRKIHDTSDNMNLHEDSPSDIPVTVKSGRPMTMQTARNHHNRNAFTLQNKLGQVQQKRAFTCHTRRRKILTTNCEKSQKFFKLHPEVPSYVKEEIELANRLRKHKKEKQEQQIEKEHQIEKIAAFIKMREKRTKENFQELKGKLKGRRKSTPPITNVQTDNGKITINGKQKPPKTHYFHLSFNPEEEIILNKLQSKVSDVNATKKGSFVAKLKKSLKVTNQQFTNNGLRQISSIPFMNISYGIALSQSTIEASASRKRPLDQLTRQQFTSTNQSQRFKSHNPLVNSVGVNLYATMQQFSNTTVKSSFLENTLTQQKEVESMLEKRKQASTSILWRARQKSENKKIKISNFEAFKQEILQIKLAH